MCKKSGWTSFLQRYDNFVALPKTSVLSNALNVKGWGTIEILSRTYPFHCTNRGEANLVEQNVRWIFFETI
jgi:hypothetical protein